MARTKKVIFNYKNKEDEENRIVEEACLNYSCKNLAKTFNGTKTETNAVLESIDIASFTIKCKDKKEHKVTARLLSFNYNRFAHGGVYKIRITDEYGKQSDSYTRFGKIYAGQQKNMTFEVLEDIAGDLAQFAADRIFSLIEQ